MQIHATLSIYSPDLSANIIERLEQDNKFTTVTDNIPSNISPLALGLLCLDDSYNDLDKDQGLKITHVGILRKQQRVATGQVRIKVTDVVVLSTPLLVSALVDAVAEKFKKNTIDSFSIGYKKVAPKTGIELFAALLKVCPTHSEEIKNLAKKMEAPSILKNVVRSEDAAAEKDALGIALDIFGIERSEVLRNWNAGQGSSGKSFLSGLEQYYAYEDDVINHDLKTLPGWQALNSAITGIAEFSNDDGEKLTVINANRKPLEKAFGVDLLYYHRNYEAFTFVQYKMMEKQGVGDHYYYNPNQQTHNDELSQMNMLHNLLEKEARGTSLSDYRLAPCPIFFKVCKRLQLKNNESSIAPGAYIPLDQWKLLLNDSSTVGKKGGCQIGYHTLRKRYIGTQTFIELVQKGFLGTQSTNSQKVALFVEDAIKNGHSVMYAIDERSGIEHSSDPLKNRFS